MKKIKDNKLKTKNQKNKIFYILNEDYFHISITKKNSYRNNLEWKVYYKNLTPEEYYSKENKPLLESSKNCIQDIYKLRDIFDKLKNEEQRKNICELFRDSYKLYSEMSEIRYETVSGMINILTFCMFFNLIISLIAKNNVISILNTFFTITMAVYFYFNTKWTSELLEKRAKENETMILRNIIKRQGLSFVERIREKWNA